MFRQGDRLRRKLSVISGVNISGSERISLDFDKARGNISELRERISRSFIQEGISWIGKIYKKSGYLFGQTRGHILSTSGYKRAYLVEFKRLQERISCGICCEI